MCLLLFSHLFFVYLWVINEAHWACSILSCWGMFKITPVHLLFYEFKRIGWHSLWHYMVLMLSMKTVLHFVAWHPLKYPLLMHNLWDYIMLAIYELRRGHLTSVLAVLNHIETIYLCFVILLWSRLVFSEIHLAVGWYVTTVAPIETIDHKSHVSATILLLLEVIKL